MWVARGNGFSVKTKQNQKNMFLKLASPEIILNHTERLVETGHVQRDGHFKILIQNFVLF